MTKNIGARLVLEMREFSDQLKQGLDKAARDAGPQGEAIGRAISGGIEQGAGKASAGVKVLTTNTDELRSSAKQLGDTLERDAGGGLRRFADKVDLTARSVLGVGLSTALFQAALGDLRTAIVGGFRDLSSFKEETAVLGAVLRATGEKVGFTATQLTAYASELGGVFNVPRAEILKAQQALATFDGVAGSTFTRATELAVDLAAVFGGSVSTEARKLGDVIQRLAEGDVKRLDRNLFNLDKTVRDQILTLSEAGKQYEAIDLLLKTLKDRVGGSAEARGDTVSGAFGRLKSAVADARREAVEMTGAYDALKTTLDQTAIAANRARDRIRELAQAERDREILAENRGSVSTPLLGGLITLRRETRDALPKGGRGGGGSRLSLLELDADQQARAAANSAGAAERREAEAREAAAKAARAREAADRRAARDAERAGQKELRAAERARQEALREELRLLDAQGRRYAQLADVIRRLQGPLFDFPTAPTRPLGSSFEIDDKFLRRAAGLDAASAVADRFEKDGLRAAQAIAQAFGGGVGREVSKIVGVFRGLQTGDFTSVGGPLGGALTLALGDPKSGLGKSLRDAFSPVFKGLERTLDDLGRGLGLGQGKLGSSLVSGLAIGAAISGGDIGGAALGAIGSAVGQAIGFAIGGPAGGAIGQSVGALLSVIPALTPKKGSVNLIGSGGDIFVGGGVGKGAQKSNAATAGNSAADFIRQIAEALGGDLGSFAVSVGQRGDRFRVDITGGGQTKKQAGRVFDFNTAEEAIRFAIADAIRDGAVTGIGQTLQNALRTGRTPEVGLQNALAIKSIGERLRSIEDPVGFALGKLDDEFRKLEKTLREASGTVEEFADLERLYTLERSELLKQATERELRTLTEFLNSLNAGASSPLSLRTQREEAERRFLEFERAILDGQEIDQSGFVEAGRLLLDLERQLNGATEGFFSQFDRVQDLTSQAIARVENSQATRDAGIFAERTAAATQSSAETLAEIYNLQIDMLAALRGMGGGGNGPWMGDGAAYSLVRY